MGSYVISVSAGTGCYRHIQISKSATLYNLHEAILESFDFDDGYEHIFFMDNHYWSKFFAFYSTRIHGDERLTKKYKLERLSLSKGSQFKYVFGFDDEWCFQCKVLKELDQTTSIPKVVRKVGESPDQYLHDKWDDDDEDEWEEEETFEEMAEEFLRDRAERDERQIDLTVEEIVLIREYVDAAARLYGLMPLKKLFEIYNSQNGHVTAEEFLMATELINVKEKGFKIIDRCDVSRRTAEGRLVAGEVVGSNLLIESPLENIQALREKQEGKDYRLLPKEEFLRYAGRDYFPATPARKAMLKYLRRRSACLLLPAEVVCSNLQEEMAADAPMKKVVETGELDGLIFDAYWDIGEFTQLCQELNDHTHKHVNRGYTPNELVLMAENGGKLPDEMASAGQMGQSDGTAAKSGATITGTPARNSPCPCGSGRKYKNCCGKNR